MSHCGAGIILGSADFFTAPPVSYERGDAVAWLSSCAARITPSASAAVLHELHVYALGNHGSVK